MSVLVCNRKESRLEVIAQAEKLNLELRDLMIRNFGIKRPDEMLRKEFRYGKSPEEIMERSLFLLEGFKKKVDQKASLLTDYLVTANNIFPRNLTEYENRRQNQTYAICCCKEINKELQNVIDIFEVDLNAYDGYVDIVKREIKLIKKWRQRDNHFKNELSQ